MSTNTTHYSLIKPGVADPTDADLWGGYLNTDMDTIDGVMWTNSQWYGAQESIASGATTDLGTTTSANILITGNTTITSFGTSADGITRWVRMQDALTLTHNGTSLILPGSANITTAANDCFRARSLGSGNWLVTDYQRSSGQALVSGRIKVVPYTRDVSLSGGSETLTGAGFTPKAAHILMGQSNVNRWSSAITDGPSTFCQLLNASGFTFSTGSQLIFMQDTASVTEYKADFTAWTADGMTINWTKVGSPTGTIQYAVMYFE